MFISVVIPTHNRRDFVLRALASVFAQTREPDEVIVIDDGSDDGTSTSVRTRYPQARLIQQANRGVSAARNAGINAARSEWVAFLDSDDEWHPQKLAEQEDLVAKRPQTQLVHCNESWIRNGQSLQQKSYHRKSGGDIFEPSLHRCLISPSAAMVRRELLLSLGLFDESLPACEDYDLWLRVTAIHPVEFIDRPLVTKYGGHVDQLSRSIWGLDRFRIRVLSNLLANGTLNPRQAAATNTVLQKKTRVYANGAFKRGKWLEALALLRLAAQAKLQYA